MEEFLTANFWLAVGQIIMIDIVLGGDNAVVIALACRQLPPNLRKQGILWGTFGAIVLRVILIAFALSLLQVPYLKMVGAVLLLWIGIKLMVPESEGHSNIKGSDKLWAAVKTVIVADLVMSIDNVIAIAGAATGAGGDHQMPLVIFGLLVSIPIIVWGSQLVLKLMDRFPVIITIGAALLGWIAGGMAVSDPAVKEWIEVNAKLLLSYAPGIGAIFVVLVGKWLASRATAQASEPVAGAIAPKASGHLRRVLLAVDGSVGSEQAVRQLMALRQDLRSPGELELHLINVQRPVSGDVSNFVPSDSLEDYHRENSEKELASARALLAEAGLPFTEHQLVGVPGTTIARVAQEKDCDLIILGSRGLGQHSSVLLGSVVQSTLEHAAVPVMVVK